MEERQENMEGIVISEGMGNRDLYVECTREYAKYYTRTLLVPLIRDIWSLIVGI